MRILCLLLASLFCFVPGPVYADFVITSGNAFNFAGYMSNSGCTDTTNFGTVGSNVTGANLFVNTGGNWEFTLDFYAPHQYCSGTTNVAKLGGGCWQGTGTKPETRVTFFDSSTGGIGYGYYPSTGWATPTGTGIRCYNRTSTGNSITDYSHASISNLTDREAIASTLQTWINANSLLIGTSRTLISYEVRFCTTNFVMKQVLPPTTNCCAGNYDGELHFTFFFSPASQSPSNLNISSSSVTAINSRCTS